MTQKSLQIGHKTHSSRIYSSTPAAMVTPRTILIAGSNSGIGLLAAQTLYPDDEVKHVHHGAVASWHEV
jgi:hypothetical protein